MKRIFVLIILATILFGCDDSGNFPIVFENIAPSKDMSLSEIFNYQNISSIQFTVYDSTVINGESKGQYKLNYEIYYDLNRRRIIQYYNDNTWLLSVEDYSKNIFWTYDYNTDVLDTNKESTRSSFENYIKIYLCTHLNNDYVYQSDTTIQTMKCSVFKDGNQTTEWVWINYKIPVQFRRIMNYDNLNQITTVQLRNIQPNIVLADSLFEIPNK